MSFLKINTILCFSTLVYTNLHFKCCTKSHFKLPTHVFGKNSLKSLFEKGCVEWITHYHVASVDNKTEAKKRSSSLADQNAFQLHWEIYII